MNPWVVPIFIVLREFFERMLALHITPGQLILRANGGILRLRTVYVQLTRTFYLKV
jgi:hypothetical protein